MYHQKLRNGKTVVQVDTLYCLEDYIDESCFLVRDYLFSALAGLGNVTDELSVMYRRYPKFRAYMNDRFYYGDPSIPIIDRVIQPLRERIDEYTDRIFPMLKVNRGKYLMRSRDYLYFAYNVTPELKIERGVHIIC